jgi:hypothetical protein
MELQESFFLSFFLSSSSSRYYTPCTPPKSAHQGKVLPTSDQQHQQQEGVCHTVASPFTLNSILRQKKNYGNSNISPCKNIPNLQKVLTRNQNPSRYYNSMTNLKFQHRSKYHLEVLVPEKSFSFLGCLQLLGRVNQHYIGTFTLLSKAPLVDLIISSGNIKFGLSDPDLGSL